MCKFERQCDRHECQQPVQRRLETHLGTQVVPDSKLPPSARCRLTRCTSCSLCTRTNVLCRAEESQLLLFHCPQVV